MEFWLGVHHSHWLATAGVPLFVSRARLVGRKVFPRAIAPWAQDSGGFTEVARHGRYTFGARQYATETRRHADEIGHLQWAAPCDFMCEPFVLQKTGLTIQEHQRRTIESYLELSALEPSIQWAPVLQGWHEADYLDHVEQYDRAGVALASLPTVGIGSICRRQHTTEAEQVIWRLHGMGLRNLHGFGFKVQGLQRAGAALHSADSMAWSFSARREDGAWCGSKTHKNCANCLPYALHWREQVLSLKHQQFHQAPMDLFGVAA
jgi:hypothetical protein